MTQRSATAVSSLSDLSTTEDGEAGVLELRDHRPDFPPDEGAEPFRRLVQDEQPGIGHQRPADGEHLLLTA